MSEGSRNRTHEWKGVRPPTAHDVARLAGVSQSAVSRAFSEGTSISKEAAARVRAAAERLGYRPNAIARMLSTSRSHLIGIVIPPLENQFYPAMLEALSAAFNQHGYKLLLFTSHLQQSFDPLLQDVLSSRVDALVILAASISSGFADECKQAGIPVVLLNRKTRSRNVSAVVGASKHGATTIAKFLIAGKHRKIALIVGDEQSSTSRDREQAFLKELKLHGLAVHAREEGNYSFEQTSLATRKMLSAKSRPDAIFCINDHMGLAAINVAKAEFGVEVGRELSIVSVDDTNLASWPLFGLTSYAQPIHKMASEVVGAILQQVQGQGESREVVVPGELVVRTSARVPATGLSGPASRRIWTP